MKLKNLLFVIILMTLFSMVASPLALAEGPKGEEDPWNVEKEDSPWNDADCKNCPGGDDGGWGDPAIVSRVYLDDTPWVDIECKDCQGGNSDDDPWIDVLLRRFFNIF